MMNELVHVGANGWLYVAGGTNGASSLFTPESAFTDDFAGRWVGVIHQRRLAAAALGVDYRHVIVPEKQSVHRDGYLLNAGGDGPATVFARVLVSLEPELAQHCYVDLVTPLRSRVENESEVYWKTDSHWNYVGIHEAGARLCEALEAKSAERDPAEPRTGEREVVLDLGGHLTPPVAEHYWMENLRGPSIRVWANSIVLLKESKGLDNSAGLHRGSAVQFFNAKAEDDRHVMIFGDSYMEYRPNSLTALLTKSFRRVTFVWSSSLDWPFIESRRPDILISEIAERFCLTLPSDDFDLTAREAEVMREFFEGSSSEATPSLSTGQDGMSSGAWLTTLQASLVNSNLTSPLGDLLPDFPDIELQRNTCGLVGDAAIAQAYSFYQDALEFARAAGALTQAPPKVLDFGVGWGRVARCFLEITNGHNITGIDVDPSMVALCQALFKAGEQFHLCTPEAPTVLAEGSFDIVSAYSVFSHLSEASAASWIHEFWRLLKPGGVVVATTRHESFFDQLARLGSVDGLESYGAALGALFDDVEVARMAHSAGEFVHASSAGVSDMVRTADFYGESWIPERWLRERFADRFDVVGFQWNPARSDQAVFAMRRLS
jgi:SAM-dependent methyltransferase